MFFPLLFGKIGVIFLNIADRSQNISSDIQLIVAIVPLESYDVVSKTIDEKHDLMFCNTCGGILKQALFYF